METEEATGTAATRVRAQEGARESEAAQITFVLRYNYISSGIYQNAIWFAAVTRSSI
jgi:hypothetical protein